MRRRVLGLVAITAIVVGACQSSTTPSPWPSSSPRTSPAPSVSSSPGPSLTMTEAEALLYGYEDQPSPGTPGGQIVIGDWIAPEQLNPAYSYLLADVQVSSATMRTLWQAASDGRWRPELAARMPRFSDNSIRQDADGIGFEVDIELRPGLTWSDGTPATVNDLKFTWEWVNDPGQPGVSVAGWDAIDRVTIRDDLNATVHFAEAYTGYLATIGGLFLPGHYLSTIPVADAAATSYPLSPDIARAVTIGPYKYVTASAETVELARDDNWAGPAVACGGRACLDAVTFRFFPDDKDGMIAAFLDGEIDVASGLAQDDYDSVKIVDPAAGRIIVEPTWLYEHFDMNQQGLGQGRGHPALTDLRVRQAILQAIDRDAMWRTVYPGLPLPDTWPCVPAFATTYWQLPDIECLSYDVDAANALLDAAGYRDTDGDGTREDSAGSALVLEHCTFVGGFRRTGGEFLADQLKEIGIDLRLNFVDAMAVLWASWQDVAADTKCNLAHGNYDTTEFAYILTFDLFGNYYYYDSEEVPTAANEGYGSNHLRFSNAEMDASLDTLRSAVRPDEQLQAVYTVQQIYIDEVPEVVLYQRADVRGLSTRLNNFLYSPSAVSDTWNVEDWWVTP